MPTSTIGDIVSDGTVIWKISANINTNVNKLYSAVYYKQGGPRISLYSAENEATYGGAYLTLYNYNRANQQGKFALVTSTQDGTEDTQSTGLVGDPNGSLTWGNNDLSGAAIVSKRLNSNGYIKYASGMIIQWVGVPLPNFTPNENGYTYTGVLPIAFSGNCFATFTNLNTTGPTNPSTASILSSSANITNFWINSYINTSTSTRLLAIGY